MLTRRTLLKTSGAALAALYPFQVRAAVGPVMATLATYMAAARGRALPAAALERSRLHVLDTLGAMVSGAELLPGQRALAFARQQAARPEATVIASTVLTSPIDAALINGVLAHSDETDDSHGASQSHPGAAIVPAALALGETLNVTGAHFLRAVALGYDVGPRLTMALGAVDFRNETRRSTHAIAGTFGAAAAAGCVAGLDEQQMRWVLDYASQQSGGYAVWERDVDHIEKGFVFGGMPARNGVTAAMLVKGGFTGVDDVFSGPDNYFQVNAPKGRPELLVEGLGERYEVTRTDVKKWTVGTPIQAPLDAIVNLRRQRPFTADQVTRVVVKLAPNVGNIVNNRDIPDICLQHMVAIMLIDQTASFAAAHDLPRMKDPVVLRHRAKVEYVPDPALAALMPIRVAIVDVTLADGTVLSERVEAVRGTVRNPMPAAEVEEKARDLFVPVLGAQKSDRLIEAVRRLDTAPDLKTLRPLMQRG